MYFPALDSLRFFASINIVLLHFESSSLLSYIRGTIFEPFVKGPFFSASLFFLLSGFIYSVLLSNPKRIPNLKPFMKERFKKLYPLHIVCTLLVFAITLYRTNILDNTYYAIKTLALHVSLLWAFFPDKAFHLNQPSWTLSVFFLCYAITPTFAKFLNKQKKNYTLYLLFFGNLTLLTLATLYFKSLPNIFRGFEFFNGMLLGKLFIRKAIILPKKKWLNDLFIILSIVLLYVNICYFRQINSGVSYYIISPIVYCLFIILLANNKGVIVEILSFSWLRKLGKVSFYTYLLHGVVIEILHLFISRMFNWYINPFNNLPATIMILSVLYGCCFWYNKNNSVLR